MPPNGSPYVFNVASTSPVTISTIRVHKCDVQILGANMCG